MIAIKADTLTKFLKKTTADGLIEDCKLVFSEKGLEMQHKDAPGVIFISGLLDKKEFTQYENVSIEVKSTDTIIKALKTFKDSIINIVRQDNMARIMNETGGFDFALAEQIQCHKDSAPLLSYTNSILVKKSMVDTIIERSRIVRSDDVLIENDKKELSFKIGQESDKAECKSMSMVDDNLKVTLDLSYFNKVTANMDTIFDLSIGTDNEPVKFQEKTDKYNIIYYISPVTDAENRPASPKIEDEETDDTDDLEDAE